MVGTTSDLIQVIHVDDEPDFAEMAAEFIRRQDDRFDVETATSASEALDWLREHTVHCIVSDFDMPGQNGVEFLEAVRTDNPDLPFILYTGKGSEEVASEAISAGVTDYLQKETGSSQYEVLANRIRNAVGWYQTGRELDRSRELHRHTETIADVGGWEIDPETEIVFWTDHLFEMLGVEYDDEPPLGEALNVYLEADRPRVETAVENAIAAGEPFDVEARFQRPDDEIRRFRIRGEPSIDDGEVVTLRGAVHDITDQQRREDILHELHDIISNRQSSFEDKMQALLELGRRELDTEYGTLSKIKGNEYVFEFVAADDDSIQPGDVVPLSATNCEIAASTEQTLVLGDIERDAPEETDRAGFIEWGISCYIGAPVFVEEDVYGTFCFYGTEARIGQFSDWEETLVNLMSSWVSYELQRQQVNEWLQTQNEQLNEFVSIVSHDLRNPLNVAEGRLELADEECDSEHLDEIANAHNRMNTLIDDLLTLAREGDCVSETEAVDLAELSEECWRNVETADATIQTTIDRTIQANRSHLAQLLENLIRNAVEHGGDDVTVTVGELDDGFYVEDDGPGIPENERDDVFDAGYSSAENGTGFGLSIVKQVVDAHDWDVSVTEGSNGGARFESTFCVR